MEATGESLVGSERGERAESLVDGEERGGPECPAPEEMEELEGEQGAPDAPGAPAESADGAEAWRERAEAAESRVAELGDRLGAVEAAAADLRRMAGEGELARQIDRELLIAGVVDLDGARALVDEQVSGGATVLEAVARVRERRPLLFVSRARGVRATAMPAGTPSAPRSVDEVAAAARESGDRRLLLRYLRMRRGEG